MFSNTENLSTKQYLSHQNKNLVKEIQEIENHIKETIEHHRQIKPNYNDHRGQFANLTEKSDELFLIQKKIEFYKDAILKQKNQMDSILDIKK